MLVYVNDNSGGGGGNGSRGNGTGGADRMLLCSAAAAVAAAGQYLRAEGSRGRVADNGTIKHTDDNHDRVVDNHCGCCEENGRES
jgi:hypothetical protein